MASPQLRGHAADKHHVVQAPRRGSMAMAAAQHARRDTVLNAFLISIFKVPVSGADALTHERAANTAACKPFSPGENPNCSSHRYSRACTPNIFSRYRDTRARSISPATIGRVPKPFFFIEMTRPAFNHGEGQRSGESLLREVGKAVGGGKEVSRR